MECQVSSPESLTPKGVRAVFTCVHEHKVTRSLEDLHIHAALVRDSLSEVLGVKGLEIVFSENEAIGLDYILYSYRLLHAGRYVGTCRFVTLNDKLIKSLCTISQ